MFSTGTGLERVYFAEKIIQIADRPAVTLVVLSPDQSLQDEKATVAFRRSGHRTTNHHPADARADERIRSGLDWRNPATKMDEFLHEGPLEIRFGERFEAHGKG